jgi:hypothetical protein
MATPRVFVSSTWYDLRYIRENIKYFIRNLGYDPVLNEEGSIFFDPRTHVHDACVSEIPNCQLFILIIGGRFTVEFYDKMLRYGCVRDMAYMGNQPTPTNILENKTFDGCFEAAGGTLDVEDWSGSSVGQNGSISKARLETNREEYLVLRTEMLNLLKEHNFSVQDYLADALSN